MIWQFFFRVLQLNLVDRTSKFSFFKLASQDSAMEGERQRGHHLSINLCTIRRCRIKQRPNTCLDSYYALPTTHLHLYQGTIKSSTPDLILSTPRQPYIYIYIKAQCRVLLTTALILFNPRQTRIYIYTKEQRRVLLITALILLMPSQPRIYIYIKEQRRVLFITALTLFTLC